MNAREPGSILDGKYEIVQRAGSGGMGEVYLVRHVHLQELRVVKILRQDLAADPSAQKRFMREARLATQIKHPNVAILYDFSTLPDGSFYMVWEHIQGQDVGDRLRRVGPFPVMVAVQLGIQALQGLEAVHATGVIHRDLSPDNLMITEDKGGNLRIKIIDLGLARTLEADASFEITQVGMFMGKLQYCSPEQASAPSGVVLDHRSDLYSFGLVLYEMIAGMPPFESENAHGFIFKRLSEDPLPLRGRNPHVDVPQELDRVVRRALERDREQRYPDARAFISALERVAKGLLGAETREIPLSVMAQADESPVLRPTQTPPPAGPPRQRSSSELSRAEKIDLLAQIDRAAKRVQENTVDLTRAEAALAAGRLDEAQRLIAEIDAAHPRALGLDRLKERLAQARQRDDHARQQREEQARQQREEQARRAAETEQVLANYLQRKQLPLARLALETLLEIQPNHPRRVELESRIQVLAEEAERGKRAETALTAGRAALAAGDLKTARRELEAIARNDPSGKRAETFSHELEAAERSVQQTAEIERRRRRFEELLAGHRLVEAKEELDALAKLDVSRVTLDFYREQLAEARAGVQAEEQSAVFESRYRQSLADHNWFAARDVALELEKALPASPRAAAMYAEVERLETVDRRQQSLEQGVRQVETFIEQGDAAKAELALKILLQMDPENRHRKRLEKQVGGLQKK
ncbi:MAG TPA: serine/threonine-protein kinase [Thermoanaerobaculia bacterium]|nr:serine/threonine-protein kinase [Thermoanaerobaculia bacterium]